MNNVVDGDLKVANGRMIADAVEATAIPGVLGPVLHRGDSDHDDGAGVILRSQNGHRWKQAISNQGVPFWTDIDT